MSRKARVEHTMMVPQLRDDCEFLLIQVNKDSIYPLINNNCGPVVITTSGIILPKNKIVEC